MRTLIKNLFKLSIVAVLACFIMNSCLHEGDKTVVLPLVESSDDVEDTDDIDDIDDVDDVNDIPDFKPIDEVIPEEMQDILSPYITIHKGDDPPVIDGAYLVSPTVTVFCSDHAFPPGFVHPDMLGHFFSQNNQILGFEYSDGTASGITTGFAMIEGSGNDFTMYFTSEGVTDGVWSKQTGIITGTMTPEGIKDLMYAYFMVEKNDPYGRLMDVNEFRVFRDGDGMAEKIPL